VVGAYHGKGKRTNVYGAFLLACYDADAEEFQTICKIGTGFSEEMLQQFYDQLKPLELASARGDVKVGGAKPDVWFEPQVVWEVLTADLSLSPIYEAARGLVDDRGISLRFPRFIRVRDDKDADDATGPEQVSESRLDPTLVKSDGHRLQRCTRNSLLHRAVRRKRAETMTTGSGSTIWMSLVSSGLLSSNGDSCIGSIFADSIKNIWYL